MATWEKNEFTVVREDWQDDVEDEWDASSEEEGPVVVPEKKQPAPAKKSAPAKKVAEEEPIETALERKLRLQRLQEAADLDNAMHLFGAEHIKSDEEVKSTTVSVKVIEVDWLDALNPETQKDFDSIVDRLTKKFKSFEKHKLYIPFIENLTKTLLADREIPEIRKIGGVVTDLAALKQKEKLAAAKKPAPTLAGVKKQSGAKMYADFGDYDSDDGDAFA